MEIKFTAAPMQKPKELSLRQSLAWDYLGINNGGWVAAETGDLGVVVTDESAYMGNASVFSDFGQFCYWLEQTADDALADSPEEFLRAATGLPDVLLTSEVVNAMLSALSAGKNTKAATNVSMPPPRSPAVRDYYVTFAIDARYCVKVSAASLVEAKEKAQCDFESKSFGDLDFVEYDISSVEDEAGTFLYER